MIQIDENYKGRKNNFFNILVIILLIAMCVYIFRAETVLKKLSSGQNGLSSEQYEQLTEGIADLENKVDDLQKAVNRISKTPSAAASLKQAIDKVVAAAPPAPQGNIPSQSSQPSNSKGKISISAKVKVENRYVLYDTPLPIGANKQAGKVIINATVSRGGSVVAVSVNPNSTISDEDVVDACKEAALKTHFAYNSDAPDKAQGTITYTFTAK